MGQVDDGILVGRGLVLDDELVVIGKGVGDRDVHFAGEALFAIGRDIV